MYKVCIGVNDNDSKMIKSIADSVASFLIKTEKVIVYKAMPSNNKKELEKILPDLIIKIENTQEDGISTTVFEECNQASDALAKEISKALEGIYIIKGNAQIKTINKKDEFQGTPSCFIGVGQIDNCSDMKWLKDNSTEIARKITEGVVNYFKLKKC